jgi:hypothetical protein
MDRNIEIKERLELALRPVEKPPTIEEVLEQVSTHGVLRGPVDWVFPAWMLYVEYAVQKIAEAFQLSEEEKRQLFHFRDAIKRLLLEAQRQAKEKLTTLYKAIAGGTYRIERNRLYAPDGTWVYVRKRTAPSIRIHNLSVETHFPNILKLPREMLELFQLGWSASDESRKRGRPVMCTSQPWQLIAWTAVRHGEFRAYVASVKLTHEGVSVSIHIKAKSWRQKWSKAEAIDLVVNHLRRGEWAPLLTAWLGDGEIRRREILRGKHRLVIAAKEPWRFGKKLDTYEAIVATGKEAFVKLREAAGIYGELLDLLRAHKWIVVKLATDDALKATYKLKAKKRSIDRLRETYRQNNGEIPTEQFLQTRRKERNTVVVAGVVMYLWLIGNRGGSLYAKRSIRDVGKALAIAERLEKMGLRPNIVKGLYYDVYIATADLLRLAERDEAVRKAIALYLAEKAKNGTPKQREIARKLLQRYPLFLSSLLSYRFTASARPTLLHVRCLATSLTQ